MNVDKKTIFCPYCGKNTMKLPQFSRRLEKKSKKINKFCRTSHANRFHRIISINDIERCKKFISDYDKNLWYKHKGIKKITKIKKANIKEKSLWFRYMRVI